MFLPVKVEIDIGAICIGVLPVRLEINNSSVAYADMFRAECIGTRDVKGERECRMDFHTKKIWVSDYRITDFTFGGVMVGNPKFDPIRMDNDDEIWLKANLPKQKPKPLKTAPAAKRSAKASGGQGTGPTTAAPKPTTPSRPTP